MYYTVILLNHDDCEIRSRDDISNRKEAIEAAKYFLTDAAADVLESTHTRLGTRKVEVRDESGDCVWDAFHPLSDEMLKPKILREVCAGAPLDLSEIGTTGLVNYVLGGLSQNIDAGMDRRQREAEEVIEGRNGEAAVALFRTAVESTKAQRVTTVVSTDYGEPRQQNESSTRVRGRRR